MAVGLRVVALTVQKDYPKNSNYNNFPHFEALRN